MSASQNTHLCLRALRHHLRSRRNVTSIAPHQRSSLASPVLESPGPRILSRSAKTFSPSRSTVQSDSSAIRSPAASAQAANRSGTSTSEKSIGERAETASGEEARSLGQRAAKLSAAAEEPSSPSPHIDPAPSIFETQSPSSPLSTQPSPPTIDADLSQRLAFQLRATAPSLTETYVAYGATEILVKECTKLADYEIPQASNRDAEIPKNLGREDIGSALDPSCWWFSELGLEVTFHAWAQVAMLHLWLLTTRLRMIPGDGVTKLWQQHLINHFFYAAEDRMSTHHRLDSKMIRQRYLKEMFNQWRGVCTAYDVGLIGSDTDFAAALWRNLARGKPDVDLRRLAETVSYTRSALRVLEGIEDDALARADVVFGDPGGEGEVVGRRAKGMGEPFRAARSD